MKTSIRSFVKAPKGKLLIGVDLSQAESWVVAFRSGDANMKDALMFRDIHSVTGTALFDREITKNDIPERYMGKQFNHSSSYGAGAAQIASSINKKSDKPPFVTISIPQAKVYSEVWHKLYPGIKSWWSEIEAKLRRDHFLVNAYGRRRYFYGIIDQTLLKAAYAYDPQGTVADHFRGYIQKELGIEGGTLMVQKKVCDPSNGECMIINDAHDSILMEVPEANARDILIEVMNIIRRPMVINDEQFTIPVDGEIGERWGEMEKM